MGELHEQRVGMQQRPRDDRRAERTARDGKQVHKILQLLSLLFFLGGLGLIAYGTQLPLPDSSRDIWLGMGIALAPAGLISLLYTYFAQEGIEAEMNKTIARQMADEFARFTEYVSQIAPIFAASSQLGMEGVYGTRAEALKDFGKYLRVELDRGEKPAKLWLIGTSLKGFLTLPSADAKYSHEDILRGLAEAAARGRDVDLRFMMMMPDEDAVKHREQQEGRPATGSTLLEITEGLGMLKRSKVERQHVRFYPGGPTVFAIATQDRMLINPYPCGQQGQHGFAVIVRDTGLAEDIFTKYLTYHFTHVWDGCASEVPHEQWETALT